MRHVPGLWILVGLLLGGAAPAAQSKGTAAEVQRQSNEIVKLDLLDVAPAYKGPARLSFTKKLGPLDRIIWYQIPLEPDAIAQLKEIRLAGDPERLQSPSGELLLYPVVLIFTDGKTNRSESWYWQGATLSGVTRQGGTRISIPLTDVKAVRFPKG